MEMLSTALRNPRKELGKIQSLDGVMASQTSAERNSNAMSNVNGLDASGKTEANPDQSPAGAASSASALPKDAREPLAPQKPEGSKPGITFAAQEHLPKLPIPDLEQTCQRYLEALEPLQNSREHRDTERAVHEFLRSEGPELNERLKKYADGKSSYIEQFWYDSFLNFDSSVVLNLNPFILLEDDPTPARNDQVTRAASLIISSLAFIRAVRKEELPPDTVRKQTLCMYQYSRLFGTARIPTDNGCQIAQDPTSKHIVVICRGQFYWFDVLDANNDLIMTEHDVSLNLSAIRRDAENTSIHETARSAIGVLSTENRKVWSGLRDVISRDEGSNNAECLGIVDSSLFVVCLDYAEPTNESELCMAMLCGTNQVERGVQIGSCTNRWYDKLQFIVCKNGSAGVNFEHTGVDGHTILRFASDVYTDTILRFARSINGQAPTLWASSSPDPAKRDPASFGNVSTTPHKLEWDMIPELRTALRFAETRLADLIQQNEFDTLDFHGYGKSFITSMGFSPDAFVQMAFQAAYYGLYGRVECVYEPAMTKTFYHGRTEAIRSVTPPSVEFVRTFWAEGPAQKKVDALKTACEKHAAITKRCAQAQGQDRHLYALLSVWQRSQDWGSDNLDATSRSTDGAPASPTSESVASDPASASSAHPSTADPPTSHSLPSIFSDSGYDKLNNTILSTSNCGNPALRHFGFGPTSAEGFGIGYIIKDGSISICASSKHRQTKRYMDAIESYFLEVRKLLRQTSRTRGPSADKSASRAREVDEGAGRRGKKIVGDGASGDAGKQGKGVLDEMEGDEEDEDGLGGYGFFDAGMLQQTLKAKDQDAYQTTEDISAKHHVGRKLRLAEY
ncbi:MAG: hypothetical protein M1831_003126 [Alyxoria varia]|nr:MAG: hypothetical protein M1831_003126 [Alyxoria varia]